ncbi:protein of unknown function [Cupriavidus taiwanensis]|nr:protein of unknown function [Cupriavidus taiwanensis]
MKSSSSRSSVSGQPLRTRKSRFKATPFSKRSVVFAQATARHASKPPSDHRFNPLRAVDCLGLLSRPGAAGLAKAGMAIVNGGQPCSEASLLRAGAAC